MVLPGVAPQIRPFYLQYMSLINKGARLNNYTDAGDQMRKKVILSTLGKFRLGSIL